MSRVARIWNVTPWSINEILDKAVMDQPSVMRQSSRSCPLALRSQRPQWLHLPVQCIMKTKVLRPCTCTGISAASPLTPDTSPRPLNTTSVFKNFHEISDNHIKRNIWLQTDVFSNSYLWTENSLQQRRFRGRCVQVHFTNLITFCVNRIAQTRVILFRLTLKQW